MNKIETLTPEEVAKVTGLGVETIRKGLIQGVFPWGYAIQTTPTSHKYWINKRAFESIERIEL